MGCFLGCFGVSSKRKHRKSAYKVLPRDPRNGSSYVPLDSSVSVKENPISSDSQLMFNNNKLKEKASIKVKKKVRFNLNVQTYEPLSKEETTYDLSENDEEEKREKNGAAAISNSKMGSFPSNHRYRNCSYEDEDYIESDDYEDYDDELEFEDEDYDENDIDDDLRISQKEFLKRISWFDLSENETNNRISLPGQLESKGIARDRSQYVCSVLNPVENLTQWKAVKARAVPVKHTRKENIALLQEIAVDTSLSNWLDSTNSNKSKAASVFNRSSVFDRSCSQQMREDRPILGINNLKA